MLWLTCKYNGRHSVPDRTWSDDFFLLNWGSKYSVTCDLRNFIHKYEGACDLMALVETTILGIYSLSGWASYPQISRSLEAAILDVIILASHWNLTGISAALLPRCLSNFGAIGKVWNPMPWPRDLTVRRPFAEWIRGPAPSNLCQVNATHLNNCARRCVPELLQWLD